MHCALGCIIYHQWKHMKGEALFRSKEKGLPKRKL
uniref:Uncharacterized protein n=1 Tax=Arundo donax TaxID=35708 RepID=A0A0A9FIH9_ARUDO